nr:MAG TPA: hypothetical protein [Caudoviricetes sp.]
MHILFCVNKAKLRTKCFVKVEHFVLPFIESGSCGKSCQLYRCGNNRVPGRQTP